MRNTSILIVLALTVSACAGGPASLGGEAPLTPISRYTLQVEPGLDRIALAVHEAGLSNNQRASLEELLDRFAAQSASEIVVEAPYGAAEPAARMAWTVHDSLQRLGVPSERIRVVSYMAPDPAAPVLVGFETVRAVQPRCGTAWGSLTRTGDNMSASNFGCAVNANLAAQIANPRDIVSPRDMAPVDADRRSVVIRNYRAGAATSAAAEALMQGGISQAVE